MNTTIEKNREMYRLILELHILLLNNNLLSMEIVDDKLAQGLLFDILSKVSCDSYNLNYEYREKSVRDIGLLSLLRRKVDNVVAKEYMKEIIDYMCDCVEHSELVFIGNKVADALISNDSLPPYSFNDDDESGWSDI